MGERADAGVPAAWQIRRDPALQPTIRCSACLMALARLLGRPISAAALTAGLPLRRSRPDAGTVPAGRGAGGARAHGCCAAGSTRSIHWPCPASSCSRAGRPASWWRLGADTCTVVHARSRPGAVSNCPVPSWRRAMPATPCSPGRSSCPHGRPAEPSAGVGGHWFWSVILRQWPVYGEVAVAAVLINLFALASPLFIMNVYDRVVPNNALETLWVLASGVLVVFGFDFLLKLLRGYFVDTAGRIADIKLASADLRPGDGHADGGAAASRPAPSPTICASSRACATSSPRPRSRPWSTCRSCCCSSPSIWLHRRAGWRWCRPWRCRWSSAVGLLLQLPLNRPSRASLREAAQKHGVLVEAINGLETIKSVGAESRMQRRLGALRRGRGHVGRHLALLSRAGDATSRASPPTWSTVGVVVLGVYQIGAGRADDRRADRLQYPCRPRDGAAGPGRGRAQPLPPGARGLHRPRHGDGACRSSGRPDRRFLHRPRIEGRSSSSTSPSPTRARTCRRWPTCRSRSPPASGWVWSAGSAPARPRSRSCCSGSTQPDSGAVLVDGTELRQIDPADLRRNIGCVPQDLFLFQGTPAREHRARRAPHADDEAVLRAARIAGVEEFVGAAPDGLRPGGRRAWRGALGRPAAGGRDRPRAPARSADPGARRADQLHGQRRREPLQGAAGRGARRAGRWC